MAELIVHQTTTKAVAAMLTGLLLSPQMDAARAASPFNSTSAMGINLASVNYFSSELPFINAFLESERWITHSEDTWDTGEQQYLKLDANGWPMTLTSVGEPTQQRFNSVGTVFLKGMPGTPNGAYPGGRYIVLYEGQGTLAYGSDATVASRSPGRDVINVIPSGKGIDLRIVATDPNHTGNYLRGIQVVTAADEPAAKAGQLFNSAFLRLIRNFRALRFMDWFQTNGNSLGSWSDRPVAGYAFYGTPKGVPIDVAVRLANTVYADAWMNVPVKANDEYITQMAKLVRDQLGKDQKIYVELSNEVWNSSFSQYTYAVERGRAIWPGRPPGDRGYDYNREWFGMRTAQMCDIWKSVWGSDPRLVCVLGAHAAWSYSATAALECPYWTEGSPCFRHAIHAVAIAPYLGGPVPSEWTADPDGGLTKLFDSLYPHGEQTSYLSRLRRLWQRNTPTVPAEGFMSLTAAWEEDFMAKLAPYKLPLLAYEGGQNFADGATDALNALYMAANRDARMGRAYSQYFYKWKAAGGQLFMYYSDVGVESRYGSWGALESVMQTTDPLTASPPKWQAIQSFITANPCWWRACSGTITTGPQPQAE